MTVETAITTASLTKMYGENRGILEVDLEVRVGEIFGFLGPNGAGKTTTINLLMDVIRPTAGRAQVLGLDAQAEAVEVRRRVGFLPSDVALYPKMTGRDVLTYLGNLHGRVDTTERDALVERFGVQVDRPIRELSMGNRQKVALTAAFIHRPELLVLDEPTVGLDPLIQQEFQALIRELRDEGRTIFLSSHTLSEVERVADRVGIIRDGRLVVTADVDELKRMAVRHLEFEFASPVDAEPFRGLDDVREVEVDGAILRLTIEGLVGDAVKLAAQHDLVNVISEEPDLEELFLAYYRDAA